MKSLNYWYNLSKTAGMAVMVGLFVAFWTLMVPALPVAAASPGDGPGGVGTTDGSSPLRLWLKSDSGVYADFDCTTLAGTGDLIACWADQSGHGEAVQQSDVDYQPLYRSVSRLAFDTAILTSTQPIQLFANPSAGLSAIVVFNTSNYTATSVLVNHGASNGVNIDANFELGYTVGNTAQWGNFGLHRGDGNATVAAQGTITNNVLTLMSTLVLPSGTTPANSLVVYKNGAATGVGVTGAGWFKTGDYSTASVPLDIGARRNGNSTGYPATVIPDAFHSGDIAEIIIYTTTLNTAQRTLVENYLAAKYGITLNAGSVKYLISKGFNTDVAGIGREADGMHTLASSAGLTVMDGGFLQDVGDYLMVGHKSDANFVADTALPANGGVQARWDRSWYFDFTDAGTTGGKVTLTFDFSDAGISGKPSGIYVLLGRTSISSRFQIIQTSSYIVGDQVIFKDTPALKEGWYYTLGEAANLDYYIADNHQPGGPTYNFVDIRSSGTLVSAFASGGDDQKVDVPLNFTFNFYDQGYVTATISSNGFLALKPGQPPDDGISDPIPTTATPNGHVAGWWVDLNPTVGGATVHYTTTGTAPNRVFIVQYTNMPRTGATTITSTFQIKLFESIGWIEVHYLSASTNAAMPAGAGIEDQNGVKGLQYYYANAPLSNVAVRYSRPALLVDKTVNTPTPRVGERITYTVVVRSNLAYTTTSTVVTDTLDAGLTFDTGAATIAPPQSVTMNFNGQVLTMRNFTLAAGQRVTFTVPVTVSTAVSPSVEIFNRVEMTHSALSEIRYDAVGVVPDNCWVRAGGTTYNNLQAGLNAAASGSEVKIAGHCLDVTVINGLAQVGYISKTLTLRGGYAPGDADWTTAYPTRTTVLDARGDGRVLYVTTGISVTLENLHMINGNAGQSGSTDSYGGGIYASAATLTLRQMQIYQNTADRGGGIYVYTSTLALYNSRVFSNTADTRGGGGVLETMVGFVWDTNEVLSNTAGLYGGGLYLKDTSAWIRGGEIVANRADTTKGYGGGLYVEGKSLTLTDTVSINANTAYWGGGVYLKSCPVTVTANTLVSNTAFQGAGMYVDTGAAVLTANTFAENNAWGTGNARFGGGGIYAFNSPFTLVGNDFISNTAATGGAGALLEGSYVIARENDFVANGAARSFGGGLFVISAYTATLTVNRFESNIATRNDGGGAYVNSSLWISLTANEFVSNTAAGGGGVHLKSALMRVTDNDFVANYASDSGSGGGGLFLESGTVVVENNILRQNGAVYHGGGGFLSQTSGQVMTNTWESNVSSNGRGGGLYAASSGAITMQSNDFLTNTARAGGGASFGAGTLTIYTNLFRGNIANGTSFGGGGLLLDNNRSWVEHNTFVSNTTTGDHGGAFYVYRPTGGTAISNTLTGNTAPAGQGGGVYFNNADTFTFTLNLLTSNTANGAGGGAAMVSSEGLWVVDNIFRANQHTSGSNGGGGVYITSSAPVLERNQIISNTSANRGGGIFFGGTSGVAMTNTLKANTATNYGGGVYVGANLINFIGNVVEANTANSGGGFYLNASTGTFRGNSILQNTTTGGAGGGVYIVNGSATLENNTISFNTTSNNGGGIYLSSPTNITVRANAILSNTATQGGGMYVYRGKSAMVANTIAYNIATATADAGAGVYLMSLNTTTPQFLLEYNTFRANTTTGQGGGLYVNNADLTTLNANQFLANNAKGGGGVWLVGSEALLTNNVFVGNIVSTFGGGIQIAGSSPRILHTTLVGNTGGDGSGICLTQATWASSPFITNTMIVSQTVGVTATVGNVATLNGTLWWNNTYNWGGAGTVIANYNYASDPKFLDAASGDYHITLNSPALDVGLNSGVATDVDGESRPQYGGYDLGADEYAGACFVKLNDADTMYTSIQEAVAASTRPTDLIKVAGTCESPRSYAGTMQTVYLEKSLTIRGGYTLTEWFDPDASLYPTTLGARELGRVLFITGSVSVTIEGVRIAEGSGSEGGGANVGGGVYVNGGATVTLRNVTVAGNSAGNGGGVYVNDATLLGEHSIIDGNMATQGGGVCAENSSQVGLSYSTVRNNSAVSGGGLYLYQSMATLRNNTWEANSVTNKGGAIYLDGVTSLVFEANRVSANSAASGGGLYLYQSPVTLERNTFISNTVTYGGGVYLDSSNAALINTVIANNTASAQGSGVYVLGSHPHFKHLTLASNTGGDGSGLLLTSSSTAWLTNTIIVKHTVGVLAAAGNAATLNATLWGTGAWANGQNSSGTVVSTTNHYGDPVFINPTQQDYHIGETSTARDRGVLVNVSLDIDGLLRDTSPDLGADEYRTCWVRLNDSPTDYTAVQNAIAAGTHVTDVIKIAGYCADVMAQPRRDLTTAGTVSQVVYLTRTLTLQGGYTSTNFTTAYPMTQPTILTGNDEGRVVYATGNIAPVIRGLILTGGNAAGLGGDASGDAGGGIYVITGTLTMSQTRLVANEGVRGGGLYVASGAARLYNAVIAQNSGTYGGGAYGAYATVLGIHTTWAENTGSSGLYLTGNSTAAFTNTIIVSHTVGVTATSGSTVNLVATLWNNTQNTGGAGVINNAQAYAGAPEFVAPAAYDYHIQSTSAAIDRGVTALAVDIDQESRPVGVAPDLGADEYPAALRLTKQLTPASVFAGETLTYTLWVTNTGLVAYRAYISDFLPDHVSPGGTQTWMAYLYPQDVWSHTLVVQVASDYSGWLTNTAMVTTPLGLTDAYTLPVLVSMAADLAIVKEGMPATLAPGQPLTYTLTYFNNGPSTAIGVVITDLLSTDIVSASVTSTPPLSPVGGTRYVWNVGDLQPYIGGQIVITGFLRAGVAGGTGLINAASLSSDTPDNHPANDQDDVTLTVLNVAPVAENDTATTSEDVPVTVAVLVNDSDLNGDNLTVTALEALVHGVATTNGALVTYTPTLNFNGTEVFTYVVTDGAVPVRAQITVTVNSVNDPPVAGDDTATTAEDTAVDIAVLANDTDPDSPLSIIAVGGGGRAVIAGSLIRYTPAANFYGNESFTYTVRDNTLLSDTAWVTVTVTPVNDAPVAMDDTVGTPEDTARVIAVLTNDTDVDGDTLTLASVGTPTSGTATIQGTQVLYTPTTGFVGLATFPYTVTDGHLSDVGLVTVDVGVPNQAPVAMDDTATTPEDTAVDITVLDNDTDPNTDPLFITAVGGTGRAVIVNALIRYTPAANFSGFETFTYTASDGLLTDTAWVTVTVTAVNDVPVAAADGYTTDADTVLTVSAPGILANDTDVESTALSASLSSGVTHGALTLRANGSFIYTPTTGFAGQDAFTYRAFDGVAYSNIATVSIGVDNQPPVAVNDTATTAEDTLVDIAVLANDTDPDGNPLSIAAVGGSGRAVIVGTLIRYTPAANFHGAESFTYTVSDNLLSDTAWVTVTVTSVNDAPVAVDDAVGTPEDTVREIAVLANDTDVDGDVLTLTNVGTPTSGNATIQNNRVLYTPAPGYNGLATFTYTVSDGSLTDTAQVVVTVGATNDAPVAVDDMAATSVNTPVDIAVLTNDADPDRDPLFIAAVGGAGHTAIVGSVIRYTPTVGFTGTDSFTYTVSDGLLTDTAWVTVTVRATNRAPVAVDDTTGTPMNTSRLIAVLTNDLDPDGDTLLLTGVGTPSSGSAVVQGEKVFYTPQSGYNGPATFTYTVSDGLLTDTAQVVVTVGATNGAPVAVDDTATTPVDTPVDITVLHNDTDPDGDPLFIAAVGGAGRAVIVGTLVRYTPATGFTGADSFTYTLSDGLLTDTTWITVTVTPSGGENQPPTAADDTVATDEDTPVAGGVLATDPNGDTLIYTVSMPTLYGSLTLTQSTGAWRYTPSNRTATYQDHFQVVVSDGELTDTAAITLVVTADNDAPYFTSTPVTGAVASVAYAYAVSAADPDVNDAVAVISATVKPAWLSLSGTGATATLSGTPAVADVGDHTVTLVARDGGDLASEPQTFTLTVAPPAARHTYLPLVMRSAR